MKRQRSLWNHGSAQVQHCPAPLHSHCSCSHRCLPLSLSHFLSLFLPPPHLTQYFLWLSLLRFHISYHYVHSTKHCLIELYPNPKINSASLSKLNCHVNCAVATAATINPVIIQKNRRGSLQFNTFTRRHLVTKIKWH